MWSSSYILCYKDAISDCLGCLPLEKVHDAAKKLKFYGFDDKMTEMKRYDKSNIPKSRSAMILQNSQEVLCANKKKRKGKASAVLDQCLRYASDWDIRSSTFFKLAH